MFLREISLWDSNNFAGQSSVGEREGRCISGLVRRRYWKLIHGIGRSGDVNAEQPKAAGSSFLLTLTKVLVHDAIKNVFGIRNVPKEVVVLPIATGMAIMLGMTAISQSHRDSGRRNVIWSRIDQKSCIKAMTANPALVVHVVEQKIVDGCLATDAGRISDLIISLGPETVHSVVLTTSTFAPRSPDDVPSVARICDSFNIPLLVNNAYGLQCSKCCHLVSEGMRVGRVDLVVQSTDKNFLVPVGGSILFGPLAGRVNQLYPGRASLVPVLDLLITLLEAGRAKLTQLLDCRKQLLTYFRSELGKIPNIQILANKTNQISLALTVPNCTEFLGSQLFLRNVSGVRVFVRSDAEKKIDEGISLVNFGCHTTHPLVDRYLNVACALGITRMEIDLFVQRFKNLLGEGLSSQ